MGSQLTFIRASVIQLLLDKPQHRTPFINEFAELFSRNTLTGAIVKLEELGLIESKKTTMPNDKLGPKRLLYSVTKRGRAELKTYKRQHKRMLERLHAPHHTLGDPFEVGSSLTYLRACVIQSLLLQSQTCEGVCEDLGLSNSLGVVRVTVQILRKLEMLDEAVPWESSNRGRAPSVYKVTAGGEEALIQFKWYYYRILEMLCG